MFKQRSYKAELLDEEDIPRELLFQNLRELEIINRWLGGIDISLAGLKRSITPQDKVVVADIGCGGGDGLKAMAKLARNKQWDAKFIGIDLKQDCIDFAQSYCKDFPEIEFRCEDYRTAIKQMPEVTHVHASLFCHHLNDQDLLELIRFCQQHEKVLIINDLERHPLAYYSIWLLTRLFNGSRLVKNDAPLSVLRGFKTHEWQYFLKEAGVTNFYLRWRWAFRHLLILPYGKR